MDMLMNNEWFQMAGMVVIAANAMTMTIPDKVVSSIPILKTLFPILNWLSMNVFHNTNHPDGMKAAADTEAEVSAARKK